LVRGQQVAGQRALWGSLAVLLSYLCGSVPFGLLVGLAKGVDIRRHGSGNIGATNVGRVIGRRYGWFVFVLDFLKGFLPVLVVRLLAASATEPFTRYDLPVLCALAAVLGHVFPLWLRFRGGKAGATGLGVGAALSPLATAVAAAVFLILLLATRYVSLGTMSGAVAYLIAWYVLAWRQGGPFAREHVSMSLLVAAVVLLVIVRHKDNIKRLIAGEEGKVQLRGGA